MRGAGEEGRRRYRGGRGHTAPSEKPVSDPTPRRAAPRRHSHRLADREGADRVSRAEPIIRTLRHGGALLFARQTSFDTLVALSARVRRDVNTGVIKM